MLSQYPAPFETIRSDADPSRLTETLKGDPEFHAPVIKVVGLGGGGCNAIQRMMEAGLKGVEFIAVNTDQQVLGLHLAQTKILIGPETTRGLGAGGNPEVGKAAAEESREELSQAMQGADMVFLTAGLGGGTGTGAIPVVARLARATGAVTIAVVTMPFSFEMGRRQKNAREGLERLREHTNTLITILNDRLLAIAPRNLPMETAFRLADDVLRQAVQGISELITETGLINVNFAHIKRLITQGGGALMAIGHGQGAGKARQAIEQALHHPLLETGSLVGAAGMIVNFTGGNDLSLWEVQEALQALYDQADSQTEIVMGVITDERMNGRVQVILEVTGLGGISLEKTLSELPRVSRAVDVPDPRDLGTPGLPAEPVLPLVEPSPVSAPDSYSDYLESALPWNTSVASTNYDLPAFLRTRSR